MSPMAARDPDDLLTEQLRGWQPDETGTLLFVLRGSEVLLIRKKRGHGAGKINGPGGKIEAGETPLESACRETHEETGIEPRDAVLMAEFRFVAMDGPQWYGYVFLSRNFSGIPRETAEAIPFWCPVSALPFDEMWEDDRIWLPRLLAGERLRGDFLFDGERLLAHRLTHRSDT